MANILIACPMRSRQVDWGFARSVWRTASERYEVDVCPGIGTLLPTNCNRMLCSALNARKYDWFAMLHDDIEPPPFWVDILIDEAERYGADVVSAVVPIKDDSGATSTAIAKPDSDYGHACRLTVRQILHEDFPQTFGIGEAVDALTSLPEALRIVAPRTLLLANTGCMAFRLSQWQPGIVFSQRDDIQAINGQWMPVVQSEDWSFTRSVALHGGKVMATKRMSILHHGTGTFSSHRPVGNPVDLG